MLRLTLNQVLDRLRQKHRDRYTYPYINSEYINSRGKITVTCSTHGNFKSTIDSLLNRGSICPGCANDSRSERRRLSIEEISNDIKNIHGDKYVFPRIESEYVNVDSNLTGICDMHGEFNVKFYSLKYKGTGCPDCGRINQTISKRNISIRNGLSIYEKYVNLLPITDCPTEGSHGELLVRCKMCQDLMTPTIVQVLIRIRAIGNIGQGECNFYCSDKCKSECTIFNKHTDSHLINGIPDYEAKVKLARNCQQTSRYVLRQIQIDQYGYHFCEKCGVKIDNNQLHHTIEVAKDPVGSITSAGHMLVCDMCHKEFTTACR